MLLAGMFLLRDWKGCCSPGKRLFGVAARNTSGGPCSANASILRNLTLLPPFALIELALLLFTNEATRFGDKIAFTRVELQSDPGTHDAAAAGNATESMKDRFATADEPPPAPSQTEDMDETACDLVLAAPVSVPAHCPAETTAAAGSTIACDGEPASGTSAVPVAPAPIDLSAAAACVGIKGEITYESLDDAYWRYVDRYSVDAVEKLGDAELRARCAELAARKAEPAAYQPTPPPPDASRGECLRFLNAWLVIVNRCRDALA